MASNKKAEELDNAIQQFLDNGGEITRIKYGDEKAQKKARTLAFHKDKALNGNQRSKDYLERERMREESMIFSRDERLKE